MPLNEPQRKQLENWMRLQAIVKCPACGDSRWRFAEAEFPSVITSGSVMNRLCRYAGPHPVTVFLCHRTTP